MYLKTDNDFIDEKQPLKKPIYKVYIIIKIKIKNTQNSSWFNNQETIIITMSFGYDSEKKSKSYCHITTNELSSSRRCLNR